jgi:hypothetical protein
MVRAKFRVEIAQDSDADSVAHGLIVLEGLRRASGSGRQQG